MDNSLEVPTTLKVHARLDALCTDNQVQLVGSGILWMQSGDTLQARHARTGLPVGEKISLSPDGDGGDDEAASLVAWCHCASDELTITINSRGLFEAWGKAGQRLYSWRGPASPVTCQPQVHLLAANDAAGGEALLLATGHADHSVRIWDVRAGHGTHVLRGHHGAVIRALVWGGRQGLLLFSAAEDGTLAAWDLLRGAADPKQVKPQATLVGHLSSVPSLALCPAGRWLLSGGRDQVLLLWDTKLVGGKAKALKPASTIAAGQPVSAVAWAAPDCLLAGLAGGVVARWRLDPETGAVCERLASSPPLCEDSTHEALQIIPIRLDTPPGIGKDNAHGVQVLTSERDLVCLDAATLQPQARLVAGGEVTDVALLDRRLGSVAVAGNRPAIRIHELTGGSLACQHWLTGHEAAVLCLAWLADDFDDDDPQAAAGGALSGWLASGSRDHSVRVWRCQGGEWSAAGCLTGHTDAVSSVALSRHQGHLVIASAGADCTLKLWEWAREGQGRCRWTVRAHEKEVNQCVLTPSSVWTAGQDKLAKEWALADGCLRRTLRGHRRGVWSVAPLAANGTVATGSADGTVRLWAPTAPAGKKEPEGEGEECYACLEGHTGSVLRVAAYGSGLVLSAGADGLVKLWQASGGKQTGGGKHAAVHRRCVGTFDQHADRVWALATTTTAVAEGLVVAVTGDAAGSLVWWLDGTEGERLEALRRREERVLAEQELSNLLARRDHGKAIRLAIQLEQPQRLFSLLSQFAATAVDLDEAVGRVRATLREACQPAQLVAILGHLRAWNATMRRALPAQIILRACLQIIRPALAGESEELVGQDDDLVRGLRESLPQIRDHLRALLPYTERHYSRIDEMQVEAAMLAVYAEAHKNA